jgi:hypothetical protein
VTLRKITWAVFNQFTPPRRMILGFLVYKKIKLIIKNLKGFRTRIKVRI